MPEGTRKADFLRHDVGAHALYWSVKARVGSTVVLDRPLVDPRNGEPMPRTMRVQVRKESLPPYALIATIISALLAVALTLVETYAPANVRKWVPSTTGMGLGFVIAGFDSISMFMGAFLAWLFQKLKPKLAEEYTLAGASGIMAGASLAGILIIVLSQVFQVISTP